MNKGLWVMAGLMMAGPAIAEDNVVTYQQQQGELAAQVAYQRQGGTLTILDHVNPVIAGSVEKRNQLNPRETKVTVNPSGFAGLPSGWAVNFTCKGRKECVDEELMVDGGQPERTKASFAVLMFSTKTDADSFVADLKKK